MKKTKPEYLPTQDEIKQGCLEVQKKWSNEDFFKRANIKIDNYRIPICEFEPSFKEYSSEENIYRFG